MGRPVVAGPAGRGGMGRTGRRVAVGFITVISAIAGCGSNGATGTSNTDAAPYLLQARVVQALPPEQRFDWPPIVTITIDRILVTGGAVPAVFPGPLLAQLRGRTITPAGFDRIVAEARRAGLLDGDVDPGAAMPGGQLAEVDLWVDGAMRTIQGDPNLVMQCVRAPCGAPPGSPESFGAFWSGIHDIGSVMPEELGPDEPYVPDAYALLVGVPPIDDAGLGFQVLEWPLDAALAELGGPIGAEPFPRCAIMRGDADRLGPLLVSANQLTRWADGDAAPIGLRARPIEHGEDPCEELFGVGG